MDDDPDFRPAPEVAAVARQFTGDIGAMLDRPDSERKMLRFTLTVPEEWAMLAAWVMISERIQAEKDSVELMNRPVRLHLENGQRSAHWHRAKAYFQRAVWEGFDADYTNLLLEAHPLLFPKAPPRPGPASVGRYGSDEMDDDIPF